MPKYYVFSGDLFQVVSAKGPLSACDKAIEMTHDEIMDDNIDNNISLLDNGFDVEEGETKIRLDKFFYADERGDRRWALEANPINTVDMPQFQFLTRSLHNQDNESYFKDLGSENSD